MTYPTDKLTRVEVIDQEGRSYVNWDDNNKVELSFQDDGKTLKVFISNRTILKEIADELDAL